MSTKNGIDDVFVCVRWAWWKRGLISRRDRGGVKGATAPAGGCPDKWREAPLINEESDRKKCRRCHWLVEIVLYHKTIFATLLQNDTLFIHSTLFFNVIVSIFGLTIAMQQPTAAHPLPAFPVRKRWRGLWPNQANTAGLLQLEWSSLIYFWSWGRRNYTLSHGCFSGTTCAMSVNDGSKNINSSWKPEKTDFKHNYQSDFGGCLQTKSSWEVSLWQSLGKDIIIIIFFLTELKNKLIRKGQINKWGYLWRRRLLTFTQAKGCVIFQLLTWNISQSDFAALLVLMQTSIDLSDHKFRFYADRKKWETLFLVNDQAHGPNDSMIERLPSAKSSY